MPDERDKPQPGAVPSFASPQQVTAPLPLHHPHATNPWGIPFALQPSAPPPPEKKEGHSNTLAFQIIQAALGLGAIIYGAGTLSEKLRYIDENQKASDTRWVEHRHQEEQARQQEQEARARFEKKVDDALEQIKQQARERHGRRREAAGIDSKP